MQPSADFIILLKSRIAASDISGREFARRIDMEAGTLSAIKSGKSRFPLDSINPACEALGLNIGSPKRAEFVRAALLSHSPDEVRQLVNELEAKLEKSEEKSVRLLATLGKIKNAAIGAGIKLPETIRDL